MRNSLFQRFITGNIRHLEGSPLFLFIGKHLIDHGYEAINDRRKIAAHIGLSKFQHFKNTLRVSAWQVKNVIDSCLLNCPVHSHMTKLVNQHPDITYAFICNGTVFVIFHVNIESLQDLGSFFISCSCSLGQRCYSCLGNGIGSLIQFFFSCHFDLPPPKYLPVLYATSRCAVKHCCDPERCGLPDPAIPHGPFRQFCNP